MKFTNFVIAFLITIPTLLVSQSCLPGYNRFTTQEDIDQFILDNPDCTEIEGSLIIWEDQEGSITSLEAFKNIEKIESIFQIRGNQALTDISGLRNLKSVGGSCYFQANDSLVNFAGLDSLKTCGTFLFIGQNDKLTSLKGLSGLESMGGELTIRNNPLLKNIKALKSLETINGYINIEENVSLLTLEGLDNIDPTSVKSQTTSYKDLTIKGNFNLVYCNNKMVCSLLDIESSTIIVLQNSGACFNITELKNSCTIGETCNPVGFFRKQEEIDVFPYQYYGCKFIEGDLAIEGETEESILNLDGLSGVEEVELSLYIGYNKVLSEINGLSKLASIGESLILIDLPSVTSIQPLENLTEVPLNINISQLTNLLSLKGLEGLNRTYGTVFISDNDMLENLSGLNNITRADLYFSIDNNDMLKSLVGLDNLSHVEKSLNILENKSLESLHGLENLKSVIYKLDISENDSLEDISALSSLEQLGSNLVITKNPSLTSLDAIKAVDFDNFGFILKIYENPLLSDCSSPTICYLLSSTFLLETIRDNSEGCNSDEEVYDICLTSPEDASNTPAALVVAPNPASDYFTIKFVDSSLREIQMIDLAGKTYFSFDRLEHQNEYQINISNIATGIYILKGLTHDKKPFFRKLIIQ